MTEFIGRYGLVWESAHQGALNQAVAAFGAPRRGDRLLEWIRLAAVDYAEFVRSKGPDARYWPLDPRGMLRFLREAQLGADAKAAP